MSTEAVPAWALILAGGDGVRLRSLTSQIVGDGRPKQFCALLDKETLLERTRRRLDVVVRPDRQAVVVSRPHKAYYGYLVDELAPGRLIVQPDNRGTGPGIVYALLRVAELAEDGPIVVCPSDHYVSNDRAFMRHVQRALEVVREASGRVVLLGIEATSAEVDYGWIEPAEAPGAVAEGTVLEVKRFWEKPSAHLAQELLANRCLWNSFVMVSRISTLLALTAATAPGLIRAFRPLYTASRRGGPEATVERVYGALATTSFSHGVLVRAAGSLNVERVGDVEWSDWGIPRRVIASLKRAGHEPSWLARVTVA